MVSETPQHLEPLRDALADRYVLEREIGMGGMATVFLATDQKHGRRVAIKVLKPELSATLGSARFLREIDIAAGLTHPHILPLYDSGNADGTLFYVMPYIEGGSLRSRLAREVQLPLGDALCIAREVADALSYAHGHDLVHRDIKPENILFHAGHALVADFGIARAMTLSTVNQITRPGVAIGTPAYMSPEQAGGDPLVDGRSDIYSLGCVLYEMLSGKQPYTGPTVDSVTRQPLAAPVPGVTVVRDAVPHGVSCIIERAMAKTPADRYGSAEMLVEDLRRQASLEMAATESRPVQTASGSRRRAVAVAVGAIALAAGVAAIRGPAGPNGTVAVQRQVTFVGNVSEASVSPLGDFLAFTTTDLDSTRLWVDDVGGGSMLRIAADRGSIYQPAWSPDGRQIMVLGGATSPIHLVYPRLGGVPYAIPTRGAHTRWSVDGSWFYAWWTAAQHFSLHGAASDLTVNVRVPDTTAWLDDIAQHPHGNAFAVIQTSRNGVENSIWRVELPVANGISAFASGSQEPVEAEYQLLVEDELNLLSAEWSPEGDRLYYLREDHSSYELWAVSVSSAGTARGEPELLASGLDVPVRSGGRRAAAYDHVMSLSADGSNLYYVRGRSFANLWTMRMQDGSWAVDPLTSGTATNYAPSASPDGEWVAYKSTVGGRTNVYLKRLDGGPARQLTRVDSVIGYPVWSPDGESIAFGLRRGAINHVAVVPVADPSDMTVFGETELSINGTIAWGRGPEILYQTTGLRNFHFLDAETGAERPLLSPDEAERGYALQVRYSPDLTRVAVLLNRGRGEAGIYVLNLDDGELDRIMAGNTVSPLGWAQDGRAVLALSGDRQSVLAVPVDGGPVTVVRDLPFVASWVGDTYGGEWFVLSSSAAIGDVWRLEDFDPRR